MTQIYIEIPWGETAEHIIEEVADTYHIDGDPQYQMCSVDEYEGGESIGKIGTINAYGQTTFYLEVDDVHDALDVEPTVDISEALQYPEDMDMLVVGAIEELTGIDIPQGEEIMYDDFDHYSTVQIDGINDIFYLIEEGDKLYLTRHIPLNRMNRRY